LLEHHFNIRQEVLLEPGKKRSIRNFGEATELPEFSAKGEEKDEQRIRRDRKYFLKDKCRKETGERVKALASQRLIKSIGKNDWYKLRNIKVLIQKLKERRGIFKE